MLLLLHTVNAHCTTAKRIHAIKAASYYRLATRFASSFVILLLLRALVCFTVSVCILFTVNDCLLLAQVLTSFAAALCCVLCFFRFGSSRSQWHTYTPKPKRSSSPVACMKRGCCLYWHAVFNSDNLSTETIHSVFTLFRFPSPLTRFYGYQVLKEMKSMNADGFIAAEERIFCVPCSAANVYALLKTVMTFAFPKNERNLVITLVRSECTHSSRISHITFRSIPLILIIILCFVQTFLLKRPKKSGHFNFQFTHPTHGNMCAKASPQSCGPVRALIFGKCAPRNSLSATT